MNDNPAYQLNPVGLVRSTLTRLQDAPMQGSEGAPEAWIEIDAALLACLDGVSVGDDLVLITWLHMADRQVHRVHPRSDESRPLTGVFATRSPDRPNPLGLHRVWVLAIEGSRLRVGPLEAVDGTPVVDIKPVLDGSLDA